MIVYIAKIKNGPIFHTPDLESAIIFVNKAAEKSNNIEITISTNGAIIATLTKVYNLPVAGEICAK